MVDFFHRQCWRAWSVLRLLWDLRLGHPNAPIINEHTAPAQRFLHSLAHLIFVPHGMAAPGTVRRSRERLQVAKIGDAYHAEPPRRISQRSLAATQNGEDSGLSRSIDVAISTFIRQSCRREPARYPFGLQSGPTRCVLLLASGIRAPGRSAPWPRHPAWGPRHDRNG